MREDTELSLSGDLSSTELVDDPTSASSASDIAAIAYSLDADIERFLVDLTIADSNYHPTTSLEEVLEERRLREERRERIKQRADEMVQQALKSEEHATDVRQLSEAVDSLGGAADGAKRSADEAGDVETAENGTEIDLDASYPAFGSEPIRGAAPLDGRASKASELRQESEMLRAYLTKGARSDAYNAYIFARSLELGIPAGGREEPREGVLSPAADGRSPAERIQ